MPTDASAREPAGVGPPRPRSGMRDRMADLVIRVSPLVVFVAFVVWLGQAFADDRRWLDVGTEAMYIAAAVAGLNLLLGFTGQLSLGHASFFVVGAYTGAVWAPESWGLDPWLGFPAALVIGALLGAILALMCCHLRGLYLTVVTFAFGGLVVPVVSAFPSIFGAATGRSVAEPLEVAGLPGSRDDPFLGLYHLSAVYLLAAVVFVANVARGRWGRAYKAIRESETAARACGVNAYWYKVSAFAASAGIVSGAGVLAAERFLYVNPSSASQDTSFQYVIMAAIGGMGTIAGPVLGAFGLTFGLAFDAVPDAFDRYRGLLYGGLGVVIVALFPDGVAGRAKVIAAWLRHTVAAPPGGVPPRSRVVWPDDSARPRPRRGVGSDGPGEGRGDAIERPVLEIAGLAKRFGGLMAISGVDIRVERGAIHGLIGPNGSGKTTLINVVTGFYKPTEGGVRFQGHDVTRVGTHRLAQLGMARTFQNLQLWRRMTLLENVMVGGHALSSTGFIRSSLRTPGCRREERRLRERSLGLLSFVGLADRAHDLAGSLAFADQRRLEIARALASDPELLLLDEPAAGMHPTEVQELAALVQSIRASGVTVLLVEHHMKMVMELCDTVTVFDHGTKLAEGPPAQVREDPLVVAAYLGVEEVV